MRWKPGRVTVQVLLTITLWSATAALTSQTMEAVDWYYPAITDDIVPLAVLGVLAAVFGTILIWAIPEFIKLYNYRVSAGPIEDAEKGKRRGETRYTDQLSLLMDLMDDHELAAFKEALKRRILDNVGYDEGELPYSPETLASLLAEEQTENRLRR